MNTPVIEIVMKISVTWAEFKISEVWQVVLQVQNVENIKFILFGLDKSILGQLIITTSLGEAIV